MYFLKTESTCTCIQDLKSVKERSKRQEHRNSIYFSSWALLDVFSSAYNVTHLLYSQLYFLISSSVFTLALYLWVKIIGSFSGFLVFFPQLCHIYQITQTYSSKTKAIVWHSHDFLLEYQYNAMLYLHVHCAMILYTLLVIIRVLHLLERGYYHQHRKNGSFRWRITAIDIGIELYCSQK